MTCHEIRTGTQYPTHQWTGYGQCCHCHRWQPGISLGNIRERRAEGHDLAQTYRPTPQERAADRALFDELKRQHKLALAARDAALKPITSATQSTGCN